MGEQKVKTPKNEGAPSLVEPLISEDIFGYIKRVKGSFNTIFYKQILGAANEFKEGDNTLGIAAKDELSRKYARSILANTSIQSLNKHPVFSDDLYLKIVETSDSNIDLAGWTLQELKDYLLAKNEAEIKKIMPCLHSDVISCVVKLMSNEDLIKVGQKVFNSLPNSKIGSKGYMGARVQPNSPTDNPQDIAWQVFSAWSYGVGDLVLGTNPVSSNVESVAQIEKTLLEIIDVFGLREIIPNCVLTHVDIQSKVEEKYPNTTGIWFQSLAGTDKANETFDISLDKMFDYSSKRTGDFGFYGETGQGADMTNGHGEGFDMVMHESRKYGFMRALKQNIELSKGSLDSWVHVNDVAGFIGPEVFRTKEQLVRCCLEDIAMGKLHGLTHGLDICSTLHMDVSLEDLDWCIEQIMPANPAYLMALPTKNDPMLSYLSTAFSDHLRIRKQFDYKVDDRMWNFFKKLEVIGLDNKPSSHFGDPIWVYYQYCKFRKDPRTQAEIYTEGERIIAQIEEGGVPIARGFGDHYWDQSPERKLKVTELYKDAKLCLWNEWNEEFINGIPNNLYIRSASKDRQDYIYHPSTGEALSNSALKSLGLFKSNWNECPEIQIIISDGLNVNAIMDSGHLSPYLDALKGSLISRGYNMSDSTLVIQNGRVRTGYECGQVLFGDDEDSSKKQGVVHIIGERPGSGHHNYSVYLTVANGASWADKKSIDHNITQVISGISDTALRPQKAVEESVKILEDLFEK